MVIDAECRVKFARAEQELLVCCARTHFDAAQREQVENLLQNRLDWDCLLRLARRHGVVTLLHRNLCHADQSNVPPSALDNLKQYVQDNARRNLLLTSKLLQVISQFDQHHIPVIPFKGPVLAMELYGDVSLREFVDLDVLVHEDDVPEASQVLKTLGYRLADALGDKEAHDQAHDLYNHYFTAEDGACAIELHWRLAKPHFGHLSGTFSFWEDCEETRFFNTIMRRPQSENTFMYLCAHGARHRWTRLVWLVDLAEFMRVHPAMDWQRILDQSARQRSTRVLLMGLNLIHEVFGVALPEPVQKALRHDHRAVSQFTQEIQATIFEEYTSQPSDMKVYAFHVRMRESWRDKLTYLRYPLRKKVKPSQKDAALIALPARLSFLYYVLRPLRLIVTYAAQKMRHTPKDSMYADRGKS
jgi:hypothetical protein